MTDLAALARASKADRRLVAAAHRPAYIALTAVGKARKVARLPGAGVVVSDGALIRQVLTAGDAFGKSGHGSSGDLWTQIIGPNALINMDGEAHVNLRRKLQPLFAPPAVAALVDEEVVPQLEVLKHRLLAGDSVDLVREIEAATGRLVCRFAGFDTASVSESEVAALLARARDPLGLVKLRTRNFTAAQEKVARECLAPISAQVRRAFQDNIAGTIPAALRDFGLDENDAHAVALALIMASTETVIAHIPRFAALLIDSGALADLAAGPEAVDRVIQEGFRVTVPSPVMIRVATCDITIGDVRMRAGERLILSNYMANRAAGDFNPDQEVPRDLRQLAFGAGPHFCIGMPLAVRETHVVTQMLIAVQKQHPLRISGRVVRKRTLAAGYKSLEVLAQ